MRVVTEIAELKKLLEAERRKGKSIGFVPTMGFLHEGHVALMKEACQQCDVVVVSIYVNPKQFGPREDFHAYPRDLQRDEKVCKEEGMDYLFIPSDEEMYPSGFSTHVEVEKITDSLCGAGRPGHFKGVATVVAKLFNIVKPDKAFFGEKDAQQLLVVQRLAKDLDFDLEIVGIPTVREGDGLATSSRNSFLSPREREAALVLFRSLSLAKEQVAAGERETWKIKNTMKDLLGTEPLVSLEYLSICGADDLQEVDRLSGKVLIALAARVGKARLIDNISLSLDN